MDSSDTVEEVEEVRRMWQILEEREFDMGNSEWTDYMQIDNEVSVQNMPNNDNILRTIVVENQGVDDVDDDDDDDDDCELTTTVTLPSKKEVEIAIDTLQTCLQLTPDVPDELFSSLYKIEHLLKNNLFIKQSKITDHFKKHE